MATTESLLVLFLFGIVFNPLVIGQTIDCQRPPKLVDPSLCCRDGGRDLIAEKCAERVMGTSNGQPVKTLPSIDAATCLAECILTTPQYKQEPKTLNLETIRKDLTMKFSNDTLFVEAMTDAFTKCEPQAQRRLAAIQQFNPQQPKCSPFAALVLGCAHMEYFKNCPAHRWTESTECALAKAYVTQCGLGA